MKIIAKNEISEFTGDIKNIQDKIPSFIKVSQSYLVNMKNITSINLKKRLILFPTGEEIQFAFSAKEKLKNIWWLINNLGVCDKIKIKKGQIPYLMS